MSTKRSEDRRRASMVVTAARILEGILKIVDDAVSARRFGGNLDADIGVSATNQIRQSIGFPPRYELIDQPRYLGRDVIENYFLLYVKIEAFRKPGASATAASLQKSLRRYRRQSAIFVRRLQKRAGFPLPSLQGRTDDGCGHCSLVAEIKTFSRRFIR